jgi:outer membrane protein
MRVWLSVVVVALVLALGAASSWAQVPAPAPAPAAAAAAPNGLQRIAFIDVQRVLARSAAGVAAREQLEREKAGMQKEMDAKRTELEKLRDEMEKKGALLTPDARREKQELFERKRRDAARLADDYQKELEKKESGLLQKVLQDISGVIERVAKEKNYYLVVEKRGAGILYGATDADLTDEIIRQYDREAPKQQQQPQPQQQQAPKKP